MVSSCHSSSDHCPSVRFETGQEPLPSSSPVDGIGGTIWNRVATAASALTVNVGKAWAANITTMAGEGSFCVLE